MLWKYIILAFVTFVTWFILTKGLKVIRLTFIEDHPRGTLTFLFAFYLCYCLYITVPNQEALEVIMLWYKKGAISLLVEYLIIGIIGFAVFDIAYWIAGRLTTPTINSHKSAPSPGTPTKGQGTKEVVKDTPHDTLEVAKDTPHDTLPKSDKHEKKPKEQKVTKHPDLRELFITDFPTLLKVTRDSEVHTHDGTTVKIIQQEYMDFAGKTKFLGFYIFSSSHSYGACEFLVGECEKVMRDIESLTGEMATDSASTSLRDLTFSGRVYIYYEDDLSLQQLADLERLYKSKGLSVIFRSHEYMMRRWFRDNKQ